MKILLVGDYPNDSRLGSAKVFFKLSEEYRALGHECDILFSDDLAGGPKSRHLRQALAPWAAAHAIAAHFRERGPSDVVDIASAEGSIFGLKHRLGAYKETVFISRSNGLEHLNYRRMLDDHREGLIRKPWTRRLWYPAVRLSQVAASARLADKLIVLNEADRAFAAARGWKSEADIHIVRHGVSERFLSTPPAITGRGGGLLFCGSWDDVKGVSHLAQAFSMLAARGAKINLTVLGGGVSEEAIRSRFSAEAQACLTVIPRAPEDEVMRQFQRHDALVFPSTYEGFGMVVVEAMSQLLPVVATSVGCAATLVKDLETGILIPPRDPDALASAIDQLMKDPRLRSRLAENALAAVRDMSWRRTALETLDIYLGAKKACAPVDAIEQCS